MKKIILGNWKMNPVERKEAVRIFSKIRGGVYYNKKVSVVIFPPDVFLADLFPKSGGVTLGAQDVFFEPECGPFTGEISAAMLKQFGVKYCLVGHSERRAFGEDNEMVSKKIRAVIKSGMKAVLCVGEKFRDDAGQYLNFIRDELYYGLSKISKDGLKNLIIAYEPIWAVGKNALRSAVPEDILQTNLFIKKIIVEKFGAGSEKIVPVLYGGSVDIENSFTILKIGGADGLLVGRESLDPERFLEIIKLAGSL